MNIGIRVGALAALLTIAVGSAAAYTLTRDQQIEMFRNGMLGAFAVADTFGGSEKSIEFSLRDIVCAEKVALGVQVRHQYNKVDPGYLVWNRPQVMKEAGERMVEFCPKVEEIFVNCAHQCDPDFKTHPRIRIHLKRASHWKPALVDHPIKPFLRDDVGVFRSVDATVALLLAASNEFTGYVETGEYGAMTISGKLEDVSIKNAEYEYKREYVGKANWYGFGSRRQKCEKSKEGHSLWGTLEIKLSAGDTNKAELSTYKCNGEESSKNSGFKRDLYWSYSSRRPFSTMDMDRREMLSKLTPPLEYVKPDPKVVADREAESKRAQDAARRRLGD